MFGEPCRMFHQIAIDGMTKAAAAGILSGLAVMQRSCMYLFGKGVQAVMVWGTTSDGKFGLDFEPSEMAQMKLGPSLNCRRSRTKWLSTPCSLGSRSLRLTRLSWKR